MKELQKGPREKEAERGEMPAREGGGQAREMTPRAFLGMLL